MNIPFQDLYLQYQSIEKEIDHAIESVIKETSFIRGKYVDSFEKEFAEAIGPKNCISCANGTDALFIALKALGVKSEDEVIVPAHSWISTSEVVSLAGGKVVFCDTYNETFNIDIEELKKKITSKTVGIIPVHLYGQACDIGKVMNIAKDRGIWVIEDCAQAHLSEFNGTKVGNFGDAATFSFYPGKNLGAMGDAGCILTNNDELSEKMAMFARHGGLLKGEHNIEGINSRLDGIQAAILSVKLKHLKKWTNQRRKLASIYSTALDRLTPVKIPIVSDFATHVWHLYVIKCEQRDELKNYLGNLNIQTNIHYPVALPFLNAYSHLKHNSGDFPNAFENQSSILSLPIFPELDPVSVKVVTEVIADFYK